MKRAIIITALFGSTLAFASSPDTHDAHSAPAPAADSEHPKTAEPAADTHPTAAAPQVPAAAAGHEEHKPNVEPREALSRLLDGNDRFRYGESEFPRFDAARRSETFAHGQKPFAAVLSCADSRAPVEAIFDQGIGDLFVIRVAGNVADVDEMGTLEYGVDHLGVGLIVVLGHTKCGAVTAVADGAKVTGNVAKLVDNIAPAVATVKERSPEAAGARLVRLAIRANVQQSIQDLLTKSEPVANAVRAGNLMIVGGVYDLQTGAVEWLGEHPRQQELLGEAGKTESHDEESAHDSAPQDHAAANQRHGTDSHGAENNKKAEPHDAGKNDEDQPGEHGEGHSGKKPEKQSKSSSTPASDNWIALGGLLGVSALSSFGAIHFLYNRH